MKWTISLIIGVIAISCSPIIKSDGLSIEDLKSIHDLHENYRKYWLLNDSSKVVQLFAKHGALIPPNNPRDFVRGRKNIAAWWFDVVDETSYPITGFEYSNDSLIIVDSNTAIWEGVSTVNWHTVVSDSIISSSQSSSNFITVCSRTDSGWKILRQIWNVRPDK
ncbi:MAG: hypothetical protein HKN45_09435 [Flavobacteriales bacterium]|nr:hypothetical protein [Flavobacteriales bacterium]